MKHIMIKAHIFKHPSYFSTFISALEQSYLSFPDIDFLTFLPLFCPFKQTFNQIERKWYLTFMH